ncbi:MAG: DUF2865 domain-containing protein [Xanthobacteraceae bacterium]|nr:DUF2865 domain-containing protein [Xanthobacteraceae bacterium]
MTRRGRAVLAAAVLTTPLAVAPAPATAQGLFDFLFGGAPQHQPQPQRSAPPSAANFFADPFGLNQQAAPPPPSASASAGRGSTYCVRTCDGKYFTLSVRSGATAARMCQAFCPAAQTKVYSGGGIDGAVASNGERYADSPNAFAYRKALKADCTCNGRDPTGLAQIDLSQDPSLRSGDVIATADGLVAYTGVRLGADQSPDFAPVANFPGLTPSVRAKLGEMKVAPARAGMVSDAATAAPAPDNAEQATPTPTARRTVVN